MEETFALSEKNIKIKITGQGKGISKISSDLSILFRMATILIGRAVKFTKNDTIGFAWPDLYSSRMVFSVNDTGTGIPKDKNSIIFDNFTRVYGAGNVNMVEMVWESLLLRILLTF